MFLRKQPRQRFSLEFFFSLDTIAEQELRNVVKPLKCNLAQNIRNERTERLNGTVQRIYKSTNVREIL